MSQSDQVLGGVLDAAVDAIILADRHGIITRVNRATQTLFGHAARELLGKSVNVLMPDAFAQLHDGFMQHHLTTGEKNIIDIGRDVEGLRKDGTVFPLHLSVGRAMVDGDITFIGILHDLTARKATQEALARSQRLDAIGQMTGGISHDFNNLLTIIIGNLELLALRVDAPKAAQMLKDALEAAEMGAELTAQLMVFAKRADLRPAVLDLNDACTSSLSLLKRTVGEAVRITTAFDPGIALIQADATQLHTAIANLALNAADAMPGGGSLTLSTENIEIDSAYMGQDTDIPPGHYVRLTVTDTGEGMSAEAQRRAFEPFFTTKSAAQGTGLGLAMVYGFIRQSGGHITLNSAPGLGTRFGLYFPAQGATPNKASTPMPDAPMPMGTGQTVLVVEDNPKLRALSVTRIQDLGYTPLEAETADAAYDMVTRMPQIALVFSDVMMPGSMNGHALAKRLRVEFPKVKILLTSGYAGAVAQGTPPQAETPAFLRKPFQQTELARQLHALLSVD